MLEYLNNLCNLRLPVRDRTQTGNLWMGLRDLGISRT
jgi:hypothetical protein